jgi:hypothetical protein
MCCIKFMKNSAAVGNAYGNVGVRETIAVLHDNKTQTALQ